MTSSNDNIELLALLRAEADRSLRLFLQRTAFLTSASAASQTVIRSLAASRSPTSVAASDAVNVTVDPMPESVFPDNERRLRALAKEIKRLITEDKRRGLPV